MNVPQNELYQRILAFALDQPGASFTFSAKLARDNRWSPEYTRRVLVEYKRFAFLAMAAGHPVAPSDAVDQAWHQHMLYTESYWGEFCPNVLGRPLHHYPSQGGRDEQTKLHDWYAQTLASYQQFFGQMPPVDIWPLAQLRDATQERFARVNLDEHWVIAKHPLRHGRPFAPIIAAPMKEYASELRLPVHDRLRAPQPLRDLQPLRDPYEAAFLAGHEQQVAVAVITALVERGHLKHMPEYGVLLPVAPLPADANPLEQAVMQQFANNGKSTVVAVTPQLKKGLTPLVERLTQLQLLRSTRLHKLTLLAAIVFGSSAIGIWFPPIACVFVPIVLMGAAVVFTGHATAITPRGREVVNQLQERANAQPEQERVPTGDALVWLAALSGVSALSTTEYDYLPTLIAPPTRNGDGGGGGGCGGGGCGGGGCGGT